MILTPTQKSPPRLIDTGTGTVSSAALIKQNNVRRMASLGLYRHESIGDGPYGEWELSSDHQGPLYTRTTRDLSAEEIEQRREQLQRLRSAERVRRQIGGFLYNGHTYASDREESIPLMTNAAISAQSAISQGPDAVAAYEASLGAGWRDTDGVARINTAAGILALHSAFVSHGAAVDVASQALKARIAAAAPTDFGATEAAITDDASWP